MTKADNFDEGDDRVTVRYSDDIRKKAQAEKERRGLPNVSTIYQEAMKFYFENKDNPAYMSPDEIDAKIEEKLNALLTDPKRLKSLKKAIFNL